MYEGRETECETCKREDLCAEHRGKWYCHDCWHAAREKETPYQVVRRVYNTGHRFDSKLPEDACVAMFTLGPDLVYLKEEADERLAALLAKEPTAGWTIEVAPSWRGQRIAHPAYMQRRRAALLVEHPEYR